VFNLCDSGVDVWVGLFEGSCSCVKVEVEGLCVVDFVMVVFEVDVIVVLIFDYV